MPTKERKDRTCPLWEATGVEHDPTANPVLEFTPAYEFDQRITW